MHDSTAGKTYRWWRDDEWSLCGLSSRLAPLYGSEHLGPTDDSPPLLLVEGEKAADAGRSIGAVTVGTVCGASSTVDAKALAVLAGRIVVLCPDYDDAGRSHMMALAESLDGLDCVVGWLELPGLPPKGDLADWIEAGGTAEGLEGLIESAGPPPVPLSPVDAALQTLGGLPSVDDAAPALADLASACRGISEVEVAVVRERAMQILRRLGARSPARMVDAALGTRVSPCDVGPGDNQGQLVGFSDPDPAPEPVDGATLLDQYDAVLLRFLILPDGAAVAISLWALHSWTVDAFMISPRLAILSPEKQCGKTTLLDLLETLVRRPILASHSTTSPLFRAMEIAQPSILLDEGDRWLGENDELKAVLNAGHRRGGSVLRSVGDNHDPAQFRVFGALAVALIGEVFDTLADRSIIVRMRRKGAGETVERLRLDRMTWADELGPQSMRWADDHLDALASVDPPVPAKITNNRARDNWRTLLAIADTAGGDWPAKAREAAVALESAKTDDSDTLRVLLLMDLREAFGDAERVFTGVLLAYLHSLDERRWAEWGPRCQPMTPPQLARMLRPFGVRPRQIRIGGTSPKRGYLAADLLDSWRRYCPDRYTGTSPGNTGVCGDLKPVQEPTVYHPDRPANPSKINGCTVVPP